VCCLLLKISVCAAVALLVQALLHAPHLNLQKHHNELPLVVVQLGVRSRNVERDRLDTLALAAPNGRVLSDAEEERGADGETLVAGYVPADRARGAFGEGSESGLIVAGEGGGRVREQGANLMIGGYLHGGAVVSVDR